MSDWKSMVGHLASLQVEPDQEAKHFNPKPAGVIRQGSATEAVLQVLQGAQGQFLTHSQIQARTGRTQKALSWALLYLHSHGHIQRAPDDSRNGRYYRYSAKHQGKCETR
jgi:hypothetical protein